MSVAALSSAGLLDAWERGRPLPPAFRPLVLLAEAGAGDLAEAPLGVRDGYLLDLVEATFGGNLDAVVSCPACAEELEFSGTAGQLRGGPPSAGPIEVRAGPSVLSVRAASTADLLAAGRAGSLAGARAELLRRCVTVLSGPAELSAGAVAAAEAAMLAADPQAEALVALVCPQCRHGWEAELDVAAFAWAQVEARARRYVSEVHALASAYGWREADILAMTPARRSLYLGMVQS